MEGGAALADLLEFVVNDQPRLHCGDGCSYLALEETRGRSELEEERYADVGLNQIGLVVDDADGIWERLIASGYCHDMRAEPNLPASGSTSASPTTSRRSP